MLRVNILLKMLVIKIWSTLRNYEKGAKILQILGRQTICLKDFMPKNLVLVE